MADIDDDLAKRQSEFQEWCEIIRDPANKRSEGKQWIRSKDGKTTICYEIAPLSESRFAVRYQMAYGSGTMSGHSIPWSFYANQQECIHIVLKAARCHFGHELVDSNGNATQQEARKQMLELLECGLFGFIEPDVEASKK